jgi:hypothetical protein
MNTKFHEFFKDFRVNSCSFVADLKKSLLFLSFCAKPKPEVKSPDDEAFYSTDGAFCRRAAAFNSKGGAKSRIIRAFYSTDGAFNSIVGAKSSIGGVQNSIDGVKSLNNGAKSRNAAARPGFGQKLGKSSERFLPDGSRAAGPFRRNASV